MSFYTDSMPTYRMDDDGWDDGKNPYKETPAPAPAPAPAPQPSN